MAEGDPLLDVVTTRSLDGFPVFPYLRLVGSGRSHALTAGRIGMMHAEPDYKRRRRKVHAVLTFVAPDHLRFPTQKP